MEIWTILLPILAADVVNPVLFAFMVYAAGSSRPVLYSSAMLAGHTLSYMLAGIGLGFGLEKIMVRIENPLPVDYIISLVLGLVLLYVAFKSRTDQGKKPAENTPELTLGSAFATGAVINFVGIPFALPYFAVIDQLLKSDFSTQKILTVLLGYNLLYALPFVLVPVLVAILGDKSQPLLNRINSWLERVSSVLMPLLLSLVGLFLVADAILFFSKGEGIY